MCAAIGHFRQNVVATINSILLLLSLLIFLVVAFLKEGIGSEFFVVYVITS